MLMSQIPLSKSKNSEVAPRFSFDQNEQIPFNCLKRNWTQTIYGEYVNAIHNTNRTTAKDGTALESYT